MAQFVNKEGSCLFRRDPSLQLFSSDKSEVIFDGFIRCGISQTEASIALSVMTNGSEDSSELTDARVNGFIGQTMPVLANEETTWRSRS